MEKRERLRDNFTIAILYFPTEDFHRVLSPILALGINKTCIYHHKCERFLKLMMVTSADRCLHHLNRLFLKMA
jgi:hypothetical protein